MPWIQDKNWDYTHESEASSLDSTVNNSLRACFTFWTYGKLGTCKEKFRTNFTYLQSCPSTDPYGRRGGGPEDLISPGLVRNCLLQSVHQACEVDAVMEYLFLRHLLWYRILKVRQRKTRRKEGTRLGECR